MVSASLYIHIPFCASLCDYCDFYSVDINTLSENFTDKYLNALVSDIKSQIDFFTVNEIPSVYIGGGTPSVLGGRIRVLFDALSGFSPSEITVEANPESLNCDFLDACTRAGMNRISVGTINRKKEKSSRADAVLRTALVDANCLSFDLISGFPGQDERALREDIEKVLEFNPSHVSLYALTLEKGTLLYKKAKKREVVLPGEDAADALWLCGRDALISAGFEQYEVSNFALGGKKCLHNLRYWKMQNWLGAGAAASGTMIDDAACAAKRFTYAKNLQAYVNAPSVKNALVEEIDSRQLLCETLLMGYRCNEGPDSALFQKRFAMKIEDCIPKTLAKWKNKDTMLYLNSFLTDAFGEIERDFLHRHSLL